MKDGKLFTGITEHTSKNYDKFLLKYENGALIQSIKSIDSKTGVSSLEKGNFIKTYTRNSDKLIVDMDEITADDLKQTSECEIGKDFVKRTNTSRETSTTTFYDNGKPKSQKLFNGTMKRWHKDGTLEYEKLPDGTTKE